MTAAQRQQDELAAATERQRLLNIALDFIGTHQRPIAELPVVLEAIDGFLCPVPTPREMLNGLRRMARSAL